MGDGRAAGNGGGRGGLLRGAPVLAWTLALWLAAEALVALLGPLVVPRHVALGWYLGPEARESTARFLADRDPNLVYDPLTGWRTRPSSGRGAWRIDSLGSRSTHPLRMEARSRPRRILFLGNSMINGGSDVEVEETIPAFCEDSLTEAGDFATMLYTLDQAVLAYEGGLHRFGAEVVVVGLTPRPGEGLLNRYIPFRHREQVLMPYFKPRFVATGGRLALLPVPSPAQWRRMLASSATLDSLERDDARRGEFESYRRFGLMPLGAGVRAGLAGAGRLAALLRGGTESWPLAVRLMHDLVGDAGRRGTRVVFVVLPNALETCPPRWRRLLPDRYAAVMAGLRREGFTVLDGREILLRSRLPVERLFGPDRTHYRPEANRLIAEGLRGLVAAGAPGAPGAPAAAGGAGNAGR